LTPLHIACCNGRRSTLKLLINYGADIKVKNNNGEIPFFFFTCKYTPFYWTAEMLIKNNANPFTKDNENDSVLYSYSKHIATCEDYMNRLKILVFLLKIGFDINETNKDGRTPLMELCCFDESYPVYYYIRHGSNIYIKDRDGNTTLSIAQSLNNKKVEKYLIEHGAL
jgi:ankyrin repeat protein